MSKRKFIDIGANLTDKVYSGIYNESKKHPPDLKTVLKRAISNGLEKIIITSGCLDDLTDSLKILEENKEFDLYTTIGYHPTKCFEINESFKEYLNKIFQIYQKNKNKIVAVGEIGLDYERLYFCPKNIQLKVFEEQLEIVKKTKLPMFLHCRNAALDLKNILIKHKSDLYGGVIHSFDGTLEEAYDFINLGYFIGINGCSLKTIENFKVIKEIPLKRILIETDAPWCEVKSTHPGYRFIKTNFLSQKKEKYDKEFLVKNRNEPCKIVQIYEIICNLRNESPDEIEKTIYANTNNLFFKNNK